MRIGLLTLLLASLAIPAAAHHPNKENAPINRRVDVIGPLGNCLPPGHRRVYNRPTNIGGKIAYLIAPSSQEAMAWHAATHRGDYKCNRGRVVPQYFYAKPYEALNIGARRSVKPMEDDRQPRKVLAEDSDLLDDELESVPDTEEILELDPIDDVPELEDTEELSLSEMLEREA